MSVTTEIIRLQNCVSNAYTACSNKGATLPQVQNSDNLPSTILTIAAEERSSSQLPRYKLEEVNNELTTKITEITVTGLFNDIQSIDESFDYAFSSNIPKMYNNSQIKVYGDLTFRDLETVTGAMYASFYGCDFDGNATVSFPSFINGKNNYIDGNHENNFISTFYDTKGLKTAIFSALTTLDFYFVNTFRNSEISSLQFPVLTTITSDGSLDTIVRDCTYLESLSFPSLTRVDNYFADFTGDTNLTEIHFRSDAQAAIEATPNYSSKWGASNATIYFDL